MSGRSHTWTAFDEGFDVKSSERTILFLCTGNSYRSRFAEVLFNSVAGKMGLPWQASSRGLALERGVNNVGCNPVLARPLQLWSSKLSLHSVAISPTFSGFYP
jgi:Low molecular weight phosphotyrosine protein phosphatase